MIEVKKSLIPDLIVIVIILTVLVGWSLTRTVYDDHQRLSNLNVELVRSNKELTTDRDKFKQQAEANMPKQGKSSEVSILKDQLQAAREQLDLEYAVTVDMVYQDKQLKIYNRGKTSLFLWGTQLDDSPRSIGDEPRVISPSTPGPFGLNDTYYFLYADSLEKVLLDKLGKNGETLVPFRLFVSDQRKKKHIINFKLLVKVTDGVLQISPQNLGTVDSDW